MHSIGYLHHFFGVYLIGFIAVVMFIVLSARGTAKNILIGSVILICGYSFIMVLIFIAIPLLPK